MTRNTFLEIASTHYFLHAEAIFCIVRGWDILPIMRGLSLYIRQEWRTVKALCLFFIPSFPYPWVVSIAPLKTRSFSERQEFDSFWQFTSLKRKIKESIPQMPKKNQNECDQEQHSCLYVWKISPQIYFGVLNMLKSSNLSSTDLCLQNMTTQNSVHSFKENRNIHNILHKAI